MYVTQDHLAHAIKALDKSGKPLGAQCVIAVSGGADSMALLRAFALWNSTQETPRVLTVLTVDHGLRAEAQQETAWVKTQAAALGCAVEILQWSGEKPTAGIQDAARMARYQLIRSWCETHDVQDIFLAHHQDDQAETFLLRLARGSGLSGLAAMAPVREDKGLRFIRPFLGLRKRQLQADLQALGQDWLEDPSNHDDTFDRVKMRKLLPDLTPLGLTPERLAETAAALARAKDSLAYFIDDWLQTYATLEESGSAFLRPDALSVPTQEVMLRGLVRIAQAVGGQVYPPRFERLCRLVDALRAEQDATLMGCRWIRHKQGILVCRECRHVTVPEGLFEVTQPSDTSDLTVRLLGETGRLDLPKSVRQGWHPAQVRAMISFWDEQGVFFVPHLGYNREDCVISPSARLCTSF